MKETSSLNAIFGSFYRQLNLWIFIFFRFFHFQGTFLNLMEIWFLVCAFCCQSILCFANSIDYQISIWQIQQNFYKDNWYNDFPGALDDWLSQAAKHRVLTNIANRDRKSEFSPFHPDTKLLFLHIYRFHLTFFRSLNYFLIRVLLKEKKKMEN